MVNEIKILDKVHLQKYIYLLSLFTSKKIDTSVFENVFLQVRRDDSYWLYGSFNEVIGKILDSLFLDVDEYAPNEVYDPNDKFNINEDEFRKRADNTLAILKEIIYGC